MRLLKPLFMLVIGMMTCTAFASTPMPEKNQTATMLLNFDSIELVATVQPTFVLTVQAEMNIFISQYNGNYSCRSNEQSKHIAVVTDVGWYGVRDNYKSISYVEKLSKNYLLDHAKNLEKLGITNNRIDS